MAPLTKLFTLLPLLASIHLSAAQSTITSAPDASATSDEGGQTINGGITGNNQNIGPDGQTYSCPGANVQDGTSSYCCVGGTVIVSTCPGWPICTGEATTTGGVEGCITKVPFTQSDYSQVVSSAAASISGGSSGGESTSEGGSSAAETGSGGSTMATSTGGARSSGSSAASSAASSASSAAGAAPTSIAMPLSFGVAGGLLGLAALL